MSSIHRVYFITYTYETLNTCDIFTPFPSHSFPTFPIRGVRSKQNVFTGGT